MITLFLKYFLQSQSEGTLWNGRPCFTDISETTKVIFHVDSSFGTETLEKNIWTTLIRGDLDEDGEVFDSVVKTFKNRYDDINAGYRHYNKDNLDYGTHARLMLVAAMMTHGDILELGTGEHSTKLLHAILEDDNKIEKRMLVSAESDPAWLNRFRNLSSPFHQLLLVLPCNDNPYMFLQI